MTHASPQCWIKALQMFCRFPVSLLHTKCPHLLSSTLFNCIHRQEVMKSFFNSLVVLIEHFFLL